MFRKIVSFSFVLVFAIFLCVPAFAYEIPAILSDDVKRRVRYFRDSFDIDGVVESHLKYESAWYAGCTDYFITVESYNGSDSKGNYSCFNVYFINPNYQYPNGDTVGFSYYNGLLSKNDYSVWYGGGIYIYLYDDYSYHFVDWNAGSYRTISSSDIVYSSCDLVRADGSFFLPKTAPNLTQVVRELQTVTVQTHLVEYLMDSLTFLVPFWIGCLGLLVSYLILPKVLGIFLS